jgi:hypothetical protein
MFTKLIVNTGIISILLEAVVGILVYFGILILLKDKFLNTILEKTKEKFMSFRTKAEN